MFILWKKRPVPPGLGRNGYVCEHGGPGRELLTPILVRAIRKNGKPSREHVWRPAPSIRSCCLKSTAVRASWWDECLRSFEEFLSDPHVDADLRQLVWELEPELLKQLERVVPIPRGKRRASASSAHFSWRARQRRATAPGQAPRGAAFPTCFQHLGLAWPCTPSDVRRAFRALAKTTHPDQGGTHEGFIALKTAYDETLEMAQHSPSPSL